MNPLDVSSYPNMEASSLCRQQLTYTADAETHQSMGVAPSPRYQRRSSVTRYSLDYVATEPRQPPQQIVKQDSFVSPEYDANYEITKSDDQVTNHFASSEDSAPRSRGRRCERRSSVTRYSISQAAPTHETRSLSPVPLARRASLTTVTVEKYEIPQGVDDATIMEEEPTIEPPRGRYRRRCSVTKYCLEDTHNVSTLVKVTVEEPCDTVESIEHRHMLANDTIESAGAGDLIVGWNQAGADFLENDYDGTQGEVDDGLICGFGDRPQAEKEPAIPEKSSYFRSILSQKFPIAQVWFKALRSEISTSSPAADAQTSG